MGRIILGFILVGIGTAVIIKTEWIVDNFGTNAWAEANLGTSGGSRLFYKLIGLVGILVGFMLITNLWEGFLINTVGKLLIPNSSK